MTTCTNNKHGCRIMKHPDDQNCWFCPNCHRKFIEDPGFPLIFLMMGVIVSVVVLLGLLSSKPNPNTPISSDQQSSQMQQNMVNTNNNYSIDN